MIANLVIGGAIFAYAGWTLVRHVKKAPKGRARHAMRLTIAEAAAGRRGNPFKTNGFLTMIGIRFSHFPTKDFRFHVVG